MEPYKFVKWGVPPLESLKGSSIWEMFSNRQQLSREDKNSLFRELSTNSYSRRGVPRSGWMFPFHDILKTFLVNVKYYGWQQVYAPDKTSIRAYHKGHALEILAKPTK